MWFEWDEAKNEKNILKHGISFERAVTVFADEVLSVRDVRRNYGETRMRSVGQTQDGVFALLVHTDREGVMRIISARPANRKERRDYHDHLTQTRR